MDNEQNENDLREKLIFLLKIFNGRPYHLAKYLIDNNAFSDKFINNIIKSKKILNTNHPVNFNSIKELEDYYISLVNDIDNSNKEETEKKLNIKIKKLIDLEDYEEASKLRDYMKRKNIKINDKLS